MKTTKRKFAIAGTTAIGGTVYWTGGKRMPWTTIERAAKTWRSDSIAANWFASVPACYGVTNLRVLEVAP